MNGRLHLRAQKTVDQAMSGELAESLETGRDYGDAVMAPTRHRAGVAFVEMTLVDDLQVNRLKPRRQLASDERGYLSGCHGESIAVIDHEEGSSPGA